MKSHLKLTPTLNILNTHEELSYGSNIGNLRAMGFIWYLFYFQVHIFKTKKHRIHLIPWFRKIDKNFIPLLLRKISFIRVVRSGSFDYQDTPFKEKNSKKGFSAHKFCGRTDGRPDIFTNILFFIFSPDQDMSHVYTYLD